MSSPNRPTSAPPRTGHLASGPAVRREGRWWLVASSGAVPADAALAHVLDHHAADLAAANRAVAAVEHG